MSSTELVAHQGGGLATQDDARPIALAREQIDLLKDTIFKGATDEELRLFVMTANRLGLDPFARQIYPVKRWDANARRETMTMQMGIDGQRLLAERTGRYRGQTSPEWCGPDGVWVDVWLSPEPPAAARVGVFRKGFEHPIYRVARYGAYVQMKREGGPNSMWAKMPDVMLAKCAESLALRAAFPAELSGIYTTEEMGDEDDVRHQMPQPGPRAAHAAPPPVARPQQPLEKVADPYSLPATVGDCQSPAETARGMVDRVVSVGDRYGVALVGSPTIYGTGSRAMAEWALSHESLTVEVLYTTEARGEKLIYHLRGIRRHEREPGDDEGDTVDAEVEE